MELIRIFVGHDAREGIAYDVFCHSVIARATAPVSFTPLALHTLGEHYRERHDDGSNTFIYSRFLVPHLCNHTGWALYVDGDMLCRDDIVKLWRQRDSSKAVQVVKHDYRTKFADKYLGNRNADYPRKNWSSVVLWNCGHPANNLLTPELVMRSSGAFLHRFQWLSDELIGGLSSSWNWLVGEYEYDPHVSLVHYTIGSPCFEAYRSCDYADEWYDELEALLEVAGEDGHGWIDGKKAPRKRKGTGQRSILRQREVQAQEAENPPRT